jgi:hypothetical protein
MEAVSMPLSTDIRLPKTSKPIFPDRCVACGVPGPGGSLRIGTNAIGWWTIAFWTFGRRFSVDVPACETCRRRMLWQRWLRRIVCGIFIAAGSGLAIHLLGSPRGPLKRWPAMGVALACLLPYFAWETLSPRPIDLTAHSDTVDYELRDEEYADEFLALNQRAADEA